MSDVVDCFADFRKEEAGCDAIHAKWYLAAVVAVAASSARDRVPDLYHLAVVDLPLDQEKIVQQRIKEALLKTGILMGLPKALHSLVPLYQCMSEDKVHAYGPTTMALSAGVTQAREERAQHHFDMFWTPDAARDHKKFPRESQPDACKHSPTVSWSNADQKHTSSARNGVPSNGLARIQSSRQERRKSAQLQL